MNGYRSYVCTFNMYMHVCTFVRYTVLTEETGEERVKVPGLGWDFSRDI